MKKFCQLSFVIMLFQTSTLFAACTAGGMDIPRKVKLEGYEQPAVLNGYGARTKLLWDVYVSALYLPKPSDDPDEVIAMSGPKRITIYFTHDVPAEKLLEGWRDGFQNNQSKTALDALDARLQASYPYLTDMKSGDVIHIDNHPTLGSQLWINGELKYEIPGKDYFDAVLAIWLGKYPAQKLLKSCLLGSDLS